MGIFFNLKDILLEASNKTDADSLRSNAIHTISHMIKYIKQPEKQKLGWVTTIISTTKKFNSVKSTSKNMFLSSDINRIYSAAENEAASEIPKDILDKEKKLQYPKWRLDQISDKTFIRNFLHSNAVSVDKDEIDKMLRDSKLL